MVELQEYKDDSILILDTGKRWWRICQRSAPNKNLANVSADNIVGSEYYLRCGWLLTSLAFRWIGDGPPTKG